MSEGALPLSSAPSAATVSPTASAARLARLAPLAVFAAALVFAVSAIGPYPVGVFQDDGIYLVLGKSLATGQGYRFLQMPGAPNATHYPPLYPALLALLWKLWPQFPQNVALFKFANAALTSLAAVGTYAFARRRAQLGVLGATATAVAFVACSPVILLTVMVLSEPLFLALLLPVVSLGSRAADSGSSRDAVMAGVAGALLGLVRSLGLLVVPAVALVLCWRRRWRAAALVVLAGAIVTAPWQLWVAAHAGDVSPIFLGKYGSYFGWLTDAVRSDGPLWLARVAAHNIRMVVEQGWATTATDTLPLVVRLGATVAATALFLGGLVALLRRAPVAAIFVTLYLGVVLVWPFAPPRFTWGIWPLIGLCFALAMQSVWRWGRDETRHAARVAVVRYAVLTAAALLFAGYATYNVLGVTRGWWQDVQGSVADRARPLAEWVVANTRPDALLATDDDVLIYLYTGRRTIPTGAFTAQEHLDPQTPAFAVSTMRRILQTFPVDYVLASTNYSTYAVNGLIRETPPKIRVVAVFSRGAAFAPINIGPAAPAPTPPSTTAPVAR